MQKDILNRNSGFRPMRQWWRHVWPARLNRESPARALVFLQTLFYRLTAANSGAVAAEYTFLIAFIAILAAFGMILLGDDLRLYFEGLAAAFENAADPTPDPFAT